MLYFIPTPIGNLEDMTMRSLRLLTSVPLVFCEDTRVAKKLIQLLKERFDIVSNVEQKFVSMHSHNEKEIVKTLNPNDFFNSNAAYVSDAGMPSISDPGSALVRFAQKNNIPYEVLPGANALLLSFAASGFEDAKFYFHAFLPHKKEAREKELKEILLHLHTTILYESTHRILRLSEELAAFAPTREVFFIKEATKKYETLWSGTTKEIHEKLKNANINGEWTVVIKGDENVGKIQNLSENDILLLEIPNKIKAKLLAKITGRNIKEWYDKLNSSKA